MPTRIIRDGILSSERVNVLSANAELFYRRLMSVADDHGRFSANLTLLRSSCYPLKFDSVKEDSIKKHLAECADAGLIVLYTVETKPYLEMQDFNQRINGKSKFPDKPRESPGIPGDSRLGVDVDVGVVVDEIDQEQQANKAPTDPPEPKQGRRGTRLPDEWEPSSEVHAWALAEFGPRLDVYADVLPDFADYWQSVPGAKGVKLDWDKTFRNRVRYVAANPPRGSHATYRESAAERVARVNADAERRPRVIDGEFTHAR